MPRNKRSASSSRRSKRKRSPAGRRLIAGLEDALAHARGELALPSYTVTVPEHVDVASLRHRLGLSQAAFARTFGLDGTALPAWEPGRRPDRAARVLLAVIAKEPQAVLRALADQ